VTHTRDRARLDEHAWLTEVRQSLTRNASEWTDDHFAPFPSGFIADTPPTQAARDIEALCALASGEVWMHMADGDSPNSNQARIYALDTPAPLHRVLPILESLGITAHDERTYRFTTARSQRAWVYDLNFTFERRLRRKGTVAPDDRRIETAFSACWTGHSEVDGLNRLIGTTDLDWHQVSILRAYLAYVRQAGIVYSRQRVETIIQNNVEAARSLVHLFEARHRPDGGEGDRTLEQRDAVVAAAIHGIEGIDADRLMRALHSAVRATVRTNSYAPTDRTDRALALKFDARRIDYLPQPRPKHETFVYSPQFEGIHLRFADIARGGIRWSDRPDDFRTEILGLVKAQEVKNAVIVPAGAKGGFVVKTSDSTPGQGERCYREFIASLLDITDNIDMASGTTLPAVSPRRHDRDDTYLVVAADKGTARFSDLANSIAAERHYWLSDAFASGGGNGYDHKALGITARGAWESVRAHFKELQIDVTTANISVVGIGDMSGDVFGNGMLLSENLRLIAAFDHRHIFIDPNPDAAISHSERRRLFALERSSWQDYDPSALSAGAVIAARTAKSIPLTAEATSVLGISSSVQALSGPELVRAILCAPADLLWNGGVGTYVKSSAEADSECGDKSNDSVRVNATDLRVRVIGEGGNLGITQRGRIEFARQGGKVNTDALDNSAGVDCSDHEVNVKIALSAAVTAGAVTQQERRHLLAEATDDVCRAVLYNNRRQNEMMSANRYQAATQLSHHARIIDWLERSGDVHRTRDALPSAAELDRMVHDGIGLTSPELAHLSALVKNALNRALLESDLPDEPYFAEQLPHYFPAVIAQQCSVTLPAHPLRREIISSTTVNQMVDTAGISYAYRLSDETTASAPDVVRAFAAVAAIFDTTELISDIRQATDHAPTDTINALTARVQHFIDRAARWFISNRPQPLTVQSAIKRYGPVIETHRYHVRAWLRGEDLTAVEAGTARLIEEGAPTALAERVSGLMQVYSLLDITDVAELTDHPIDDTADLYFALSHRWRVNTYLDLVARLNKLDSLDALARLALREEFYASLRSATIDIISDGDPTEDTAARLRHWEQIHAQRLSRARNILDRVNENLRQGPSLSLLTIASHQLSALGR
jgi:glutamate dehydrogenase